MFAFIDDAFTIPPKNVSVVNVFPVNRPMKKVPAEIVLAVMDEANTWPAMTFAVLIFEKIPS